MRKSVFEDSGGFDESFFAHQEEIDLQWRIHLMGYTIKAAPQSVVYHRNAATLPMESPRKKYLNHRNSLLMLLSNYNLPLTLYLFPIRFVLEFVAALYAVALFDFPHVLAVFKSLGWIVIHPRLIARRRRRVHLLRKLSDKEMMGKFYSGSVVFDLLPASQASLSGLDPQSLTIRFFVIRVEGNHRFNNFLSVG